MMGSLTNTASDSTQSFCLITTSPEVSVNQDLFVVYRAFVSDDCLMELCPVSIEVICSNRAMGFI